MRRLESLEADMVPHLERLARELELDLKVRRPPRGPDLLLRFGGGADPEVLVAVEVCSNPRLAPVLHAAEKAARFAEQVGGIPAVGLPHIGQRVAEALRERGVGFISLDGALSLRGPSLLLEREAVSQSSPWEQDVSLFADKSSLVLRYLFEHPGVPVRFRDLSRALDVSPGLISRVLDRLRRDGFLIPRGDAEELVERDVLLDDWKELYKRRARRQREERLYLHARQIDEVLSRLSNFDQRFPRSPKWALSFQAGASLVRPFAYFSEVHLLVSPDGWERNVEELREVLELMPAEREANVVLVEPYYRHSWDYGSRKVRGLPVVSNLQLYLDLSVYPRRGAEQAEVLRGIVLNPGQPDAPAWISKA